MENAHELDAGANVVPSSKPSGTSKTPPRSYRRHGFTPYLRGRSKADAGQIDGRSALAQAMAQYRADLLSSLGGAENLSAQELTLLELCVRDHLIVQSIDAYLLQAGLFNKKKRSAYSLTMQRMQIADSLTRRLQSLGLKRRDKRTQGLHELLIAQGSGGGTQ
jgi:hypothetical protein